jgi:hypothetical protein
MHLVDLHLLQFYCFLISIIVFSSASHSVFEFGLAVLQLITGFLIHQLKLVYCIEIVDVLVAQFVEIAT